MGSYYLRNFERGNYSMKKLFKHLKTLVALLALISLVPQISATNKKNSKSENNQIESITVDCAFSIGKWCICAKHLQNNNLREIASPLDWMRSYSLDTVAHLFETKFEDFFENVKITCKRRKSSGNRAVYDTTNHIESIHYMPADVPFDEAYKEFKKTMDRRAKKVDKIISSSKSILLLNCRNYPGRSSYKNSTDKELKKFAVRFAKAYPNLEKIYLIDIHNDKNKKIHKRIIQQDTKIKIIQYKFKNIDNKNFFPPFGNEKAWNKILENVKLSTQKTESSENLQSF